MSRIRANTITNQNANGAPNFPDGITVTGIVTATTTSQNITGTLAVTGDATFSGNVGIAGTLTYEDVTNIDSVGIITARSGIKIGVGGTIGSSGGGIVTYFGDGGQLTGISVDSTKIETGNTKVETIDTGSDGHVKVTTEGTERLRITTDGKLGIGTANPARALQINFGTEGNTNSRLLRLASADHTERYDFSLENTNSLTIQNGSDDTSIIQLHNSGYVTKPNTPMFQARNGGGTVSIGQGVIPFGTVMNNVGGHYNNSNHRFTAPVAGVYYFYVGWYVVSHSNHRVALQINGSEFTQPYISGYNTGQSSGVVNQSSSQFVLLSANDYVSVWTDGTFTPYGSHLGWGGCLLH